MGLDIGVVQINYLPRPDKPAYDFAWHLNINDDSLVKTRFEEVPAI